MRNLRFDPVRLYLRLLSGRRYVAALTIFATVGISLLIEDIGYRMGWWHNYG